MNHGPVPVYIIAHDRLECLAQLVDQLEHMTGIGEIVICDHRSTYQPLLDWYGSLPHRVVPIEVPAEGATRAVFDLAWGEGEVRYVVTDPDCIPQTEDLIPMLHEGLDRYRVRVAGPALDLLAVAPIYQGYRLAWENEAAHWCCVADGDFSLAMLDTTFGLYERYRVSPVALRAGYPHVAEHTTWALDLEHLPSDERWYRANTESSYNAPSRRAWHPELARRLRALLRAYRDEGTRDPAEWQAVHNLSECGMCSHRVGLGMAATPAEALADLAAEFRVAYR